MKIPIFLQDNHAKSNNFDDLVFMGVAMIISNCILYCFVFLVLYGIMAFIGWEIVFCKIYVTRVFYSVQLGNVS